ncbi:MAG: type II secretion system protein [Prosthecobacter sp.]
MKIYPGYNHKSAFSLVELLVVVAIIAVLASLTLGAYTFAMRDSKRRTTVGSLTAIASALDDYQTQFGEYPAPANVGSFAEILPGKSYDVGGAACLYQALRGDGYDQIAGVSGSGQDDASSDGKIEDGEIANMIFKEMPDTMWSRSGNVFFLIDAFGRPFQYIKASAATSNSDSGNSSQSTTINPTYDLWSYAEDDVNTRKTSIEAMESPQISKKWITNWK